jgi:hypothetical protein
MTTLIPKYDQSSTGAVNRPSNLKLSEIILTAAIQEQQALIIGLQTRLTKAGL